MSWRISSRAYIREGEEERRNGGAGGRERERGDEMPWGTARGGRSRTVTERAGEEKGGIQADLVYTLRRVHTCQATAPEEKDIAAD
jgi:hypothetical protein